jgi:hypothetical protein
MALPVAAAIPLMCFLFLEPSLPVGSTSLLSTERRLFIFGTLAGLPIIFCVAWLARSLVRLRPKPALALATLTILTSLATAAVWFWFDMKSKSAIEHYSATGWYLVALPGAYAAVMLVLLASVVLKIHRYVRPVSRDGR